VDLDYSNRRLGTLVVSALITVRIIAAPLLWYAYTRERVILALGVFVVAVLTDGLDGSVARRFGGTPIPILGPYADPAADFLFVTAAFAAFVRKGLYPSWVPALLILLFAQFVLTSRLDRPVYDPAGKYLGLFLFGAVGLTLVYPHPLVCRGVLAGILGISAVSLVCRAAFLLGRRE
jgi:phosphatidylglycerophosphate synthase